jgi:hypothetical protein
MNPKDGLRPVIAAIKSEIVRATRDARDIAKRTVQLHYSGPTGATSLSVGTGYLRAKGVKDEIRGGPPPAEIRARVYVKEGDPVYAEIHETGGTITAKGKFLAIPIKGGPAYPLTRASARKVGPRDFPGGFFLRFGGRLFYMRRSGKKGRGALQAIFLLVRSVRIPARPVWQQSGEEVVAPIARRYEQAIERCVALARTG